MLNLKSLILSLSPEEYQKFSNGLLDSKAEKYYTLLVSYRENSSSDLKIMRQLEVNSNAFYVLKSRLYVKLQDFLLDTLDAEPGNNYAKLSLIDKLVYSFDREKSQAILLKFEKKLQAESSYQELLVVYKALWKIFADHPVRRQQYMEKIRSTENSLSGTLGLEESFNEFMMAIDRHYASHSDEDWQTVQDHYREVVTRAENTPSRKHDFWKGVATAVIATYEAKESEMADGFNELEWVGEQMESIANMENPGELKYWLPVLELLRFKSYVNNGVLSSPQHFQKVNDWSQELSSFPHPYFINTWSKVRMAYMSKFNLEKELEQQHRWTFEEYNPSVENDTAYITFRCEQALSSFHKGEFDRSSQLLNNLLSDVSFKYFSHAEIEVKLLLSISLLSEGKFEVAWNLVRSASRKLRELQKEERYEGGALLAKILRTHINSTSRNVADRLADMATEISKVNKGPDTVLGYINFQKVVMNGVIRKQRMAA